MFQELFHELQSLSLQTRLLEILDWNENLQESCLQVWSTTDITSSASIEDVMSDLVDALPQEFDEYQEELYQFLMKEVVPFMSTPDKFWKPVGEA